MIKLTEILWPNKGSLLFHEREIYVADEKIKYMAQDRMTLSAPPQYISVVFGDKKIPQKY